MPASRNSLGLVLRWRKHKDQDRYIDILTPSHGRQSLLAKGVQKINSKRNAALQPGSIVKFQIKSFGTTNMLIEAQLIENLWPLSFDLAAWRDMSALLEITYHTSLEDIEQEVLFEQICDLLRVIKQTPSGYQRGEVRARLFELLEYQGIESPPENKVSSVSDLVEQVMGRPIRSFAFLQV